MGKLWNAYKEACLRNPDWFVGCYLGVCVLYGIASSRARHYKQMAEEYKEGLLFYGKRVLLDGIVNNKKED